MELSHKTLKDRQRLERHTHSENLGLRVHRALSWLDRAEKEKSAKDIDAQFIFLWISFNSAYANEIHDNRLFSEQATFGNFLSRLCELDTNNRLYNLVWNEFASSIRLLLANKYVFAGFWEHQRQVKTADEWKTEFDTANSISNKALGNKDTATVLSIVFARLYTLRNQMLHGGATWNSSVNIDQKRDATNFIAKFVPFVIEIMLDNADQVWGTANYPVISDT